MKALPSEPLVCMDQVDPDDTAAVETPVERAMDCVAACMTRRKDPFIWHFAKRGHELEFAKALLQSMRAKESHCIHELHTFSCVAFVLDSTSEPPAQTEKVDVRSVEGLASIIESGDSRSLALMGYPEYEAAMLCHMNPERLADWQQLTKELPAIREDYAKEHGPLMYLHFLGLDKGCESGGMCESMLDHLATVADNRSACIYTESACPEACELYHRKGFREVRKYRVGGDKGGGGLEMLVVVRDPRSVQEV